MQSRALRKEHNEHGLSQEYDPSHGVDDTGVVILIPSIPKKHEKSEESNRYRQDRGRPGDPGQSSGNFKCILNETSQRDPHLDGRSL